MDINIYKLKIRHYRETKGLTQKELAEMLGLSRSYFGELENGTYDIKLSLLIKISNILGVDPCELVELEE